MPRLAVEQWEQEHRQHVAEILEEIDMLYQDATDEMVHLGMAYGYTEADSKPFRFSSSKLRSEQAAQSVSAFQKKLLGIVTTAMAAEWAFANEKTDSWVKKLFSNPADGYMQHNLEALNAFIGRKQYGHTLSDRVWDCSKQFQRNIEWALSVGLAEGRSAANISRDVRSYLAEPDKLFRKVRDQYGNLVLSKAASGYHPGQGVYRSSYQNAMRMARTEINGAYREADHIRWQQLDFIVGIEVKTSKTHRDWLAKDWIPRFKNRGIVPEEICDTMEGKYPKDFKFIGWHPNCRCYAVPILANEGIDGVDWWDEPKNEVTDVPEKAHKWLEVNSDRIEKANNRGTLPYWVVENTKYTSIEVSAMNSNRKPQIISASRKEYKSLSDQWQRILFDEVSGGYVVCERGKILQSEKSKNERLKYNKELGIAKILAENGKRVQLPEEFSREHRFDAFVDGVPSDFKRASSANNLMKYARYATQKQGAKQVVFAFPKMTDEIHRELNKLIKLGFKVMYFTEEGGALRVL